MTQNMNEYLWEDLNIGLSSSFSAKITEEMLENFLTYSGDHNPIHIDKSYAEEHGFKDRVVHGLLVASFYSTLVGVRLPGKHSFLHEINVAFLEPVFIDDELIIVGEITYLNNAYKQVEIRAEIKNKNGKKVSRAKIKVGIRGSKSWRRK